PSDEALDAAVLTRINEQRALNMLAPYPSQAQLVQAARRHVHDMADNDVFTHTGSDGSTAAQRIAEACYEAAWTSEIIGWGFPTVDAMMGWWLDSDTHRQTILNVSLEEMGVAYLRQPDSSFTHYWTVTFAKAASSTADAPFYHCETRLVEPGRGLSVQWWQDEPCPASGEIP
ncbi:MAG: CAP domain-containing protein, partial [Anaerolineales bacterium]|nr:CAP domain-containing protein [Anaerolineales bacterium]